MYFFRLSFQFRTNNYSLPIHSDSVFRVYHTTRYDRVDVLSDKKFIITVIDEYPAPKTNCSRLIFLSFLSTLFTKLR